MVLIFQFLEMMMLEETINDAKQNVKISSQELKPEEIKVDEKNVKEIKTRDSKLN